MSALTKEFLQSIGIELDDATYQAFAKHFDDTLNHRIIDEVVDELDDAQLAEFNSLKDADSDQLLQWIQTNVTDLTGIIQDEVDILLGDIAENADEI